MCIPHYFVHGRLACFHLLPIVNNAVMNTGVQIFLQDPAFNSFGYICRSGLAESNGNSVLNFLKNCRTVFEGKLFSLRLSLCYFIPRFTPI